MRRSDYDHVLDQREDEDFAIEHAELNGATEFFTDEMAQLEAIADHRTINQLKRIMEAQRGFK